MQMDFYYPEQLPAQVIPSLYSIDCYSFVANFWAAILFKGFDRYTLALDCWMMYFRSLRLSLRFLNVITKSWCVRVCPRLIKNQIITQRIK